MPLPGPVPVVFDVIVLIVVVIIVVVLFVVLVVVVLINFLGCHFLSCQFPCCYFLILSLHAGLPASKIIHATLAAGKEPRMQDC